MNEIKNEMKQQIKRKKKKHLWLTVVLLVLLLLITIESAWMLYAPFAGKTIEIQMVNMLGIALTLYTIKRVRFHQVCTLASLDFLNHMSDLHKKV